MEDKKMVLIENSDGTKIEAEFVTYLISKDKMKTYLVYSKGEKVGEKQDEVIYIAKLIKDGDIIKIDDIQDDAEWAEVQTLLKEIANVKS